MIETWWLYTERGREPTWTQRDTRYGIVRRALARPCAMLFGLPASKIVS